MAHAWVIDVQRDLWLFMRFFGTQHAYIFLQHSRSWATCALHSEEFASQAVSHLNASVLLITTSAQDSHPLWTHLGIQIGCMSSTALTVLLLSTALHHSCSHDINILHTLPVWHISHKKNLFTPRTLTSDLIPTWCALFRLIRYVNSTYVVLSYSYRMINTIHMCLVNVTLSDRWVFATWNVLLPTFCSNDIIQ
jgi:hypothetical protein